MFKLRCCAYVAYIYRMCSLYDYNHYPTFVDDSPLHRAIRENWFQRVLQLISECDINLDLQNKNGDTPLLYSLKYARSNKLISALIGRGCDPNIANRRKETALHIAVERRDAVITLRLLESGADINAKDCERLTPLHRAVAKRREANIHALLYFGASVNEKNSRRQTPLSLSIQKRYLQSTSVSLCLLNYTVPLNGRDCDGLTFLHRALRLRSPVALDIIEAGANVNVLFPNGKHCISYSFEYEDCDVFLATCERANLKLLLDLGSGKKECFLETFLKWKIKTQDYLKSLYLVFESVEVNAFVQQYINKDDSEGQGMFYIFENHTLSLEDRLKIIYLLLGYGFEISFRDISALYAKYSNSDFYLDESIELLLNHGSLIHENKYLDTYTQSPVICRVCYDNFEVHSNRSNELQIRHTEIRKYRTLYKANFDTNTIQISRSYHWLSRRQEYPNHFYTVPEIPSLVQLSRDAFRAAAYKNCSSERLFEVYQMFSNLQVPELIKDILKLKVPIYKLETKYESKMQSATER